MKDKYFRLTLLVALFIFNVSAYADNDSVNDLKEKISQTNDLNKLIDYYKDLSKIYIGSGDSNSLASANKLIELSKKSNSEFSIANSFNIMGLAMKSTNDTYTAIDYFLQEKQIREDIQDHLGLAECYKNLGECYRSFFEYKTAINYLLTALSNFKDRNYTKGIAETLNRLAAVYAEYDIKEQRIKSLEYAFASKEIAEKMGDQALLVSNYIIIGADYGFLKDEKLSLQYFSEALELIESCKNKTDKALILKGIATAYYFMNELDKALQYGALAYNEALSKNNKVYIWLSSHILFMTYNRLNRIDSAYKYIGISGDTRSSMYYEEKERAVYRVEAKYQKKQLDEQTIRSNLLNLMYILSISFILIILTLIILRYRHLKKSNDKLSKQHAIINNQKEELSALNATKDKFFSIIAHDLKNPLSAFKTITGALYTMYHDFSEEDRLESLEMIQESADNLYSLLENLLEWSGTQRGKIVFNPIDIDLSYIVNSNFDLLNNSAKNKNIELILNVEKNTNIHADYNMINTVIRNLISNAIKFTPDFGTVTISCLVSKENTNISVFDSGVGISKERIDKLFKIDSQSSTKGTNNESGTGLGLILCKEFVEKHSGKIWVNSEIGKGSEFTFTIPNSLN